MTRRPGMSLTEVLVALFILTLGVIGILTMFPLGAAQMARAVRDDRSALAAVSADGYMRWYWQTYAVTNQEPNFTPGTPNCLFDNPAFFGGPLSSLPPLSQNVNAQNIFAKAGQMSYPVVVDPMGWAAGRQNFFGESPFTQIPRCTLNWIQTQPPVNGLLQQSHLGTYALRACSLTDSLGYNDNGTPSQDLEMRYNWLWILQRPQFINESSTSINNLYTANMTVVVFDRRPFLYPPPSVTGFETVISGVSMTSGLTSVTINYGTAQQALDLVPGSWLMDATITPANPPAIPRPIRQANFYRVVSVVQVSSTQMNLELQTPISAPTGYPPMGYTYTGTLVALRGVSGVFVRPPLTPY